MSEEIDKKREEYVNVYRRAWGTNSGLSSVETKALTKTQLDERIRSLRRFIEMRETNIRNERINTAFKSMNEPERKRLRA